eukprot:1618005-Rhodomonas_salina.3
MQRGVRASFTANEAHQDDGAISLDRFSGLSKRKDTKRAVMEHDGHAHRPHAPRMHGWEIPLHTPVTIQVRHVPQQISQSSCSSPPFSGCHQTRRSQRRSVKIDMHRLTRQP